MELSLHYNGYVIANEAYSDIDNPLSDIHFRNLGEVLVFPLLYLEGHLCRSRTNNNTFPVIFLSEAIYICTVW